MAADVIPLREAREPSCLICVNALVGDETYCRLFEEFILNERSVALQCDAYDEDPEKR